MSNLRKLEKRDESELLRLFQQLTERKINLAIDELLNDAAVTTIVIEENNAMAGTASLVHYYLPTGGRVGRIEDVVVDEKFRGKGFGKMLMEKLIEIAKENNLTKLQLTSSPKRQAARGMYVTMGFEMKDTNVFILDL